MGSVLLKIHCIQNIKFPQNCRDSRSPLGTHEPQHLLYFSGKLKFSCRGQATRHDSRGTAVHENDQVKAPENKRRHEDRSAWERRCR